MKYYKIILNFLLSILLISVFTNSKAQCDDPLSLDWIQSYLGSRCTDKIYAFTYNNESYVYATSTPSCIAADAANTLYNCNTDGLCYIFGFTLPEEQCGEIVQQNIEPFLTEENVIYPTTVTRTCGDPLQLEWLKPFLKANCTDGVYAFEHKGVDYVYRSTACEIVDDPNYLYNCANAQICYVDGRTLPETRCDLTSFPLNDYLIRENLIWSTPLLELVNEFQWLPGMLNIKSCNTETVGRYEGTDDAVYVFIDKEATAALYTAAGEQYCFDSPDCLSSNNLDKPTTEWACNARGATAICEAIDADNLPSWLREYTAGLSCECGGEILQYCYNNVTYISYEANAPFCADYAGFIFDEAGTQICQNGGFTGGDCFTVLPGFFEEATPINDLWACEDCSELAFAEAYLGCSSCCDDVVYYTITGTTTNYTVTNANSGEVLLNGDPVGAIGPDNNINLLVTTNAGCSTTTSIPFQPFCCEVPPACEIVSLFYDCEAGLTAAFSSIFGAPTDYCGEQAIFQDQLGNTYQTGDTLIANGVYELTLANEGNYISPPCATFELEVECGNDDPCALDAGEIVSNPNICGEGIVSLEADYEYTGGPDDNEYVFVQVNTDDSFEVLSNNYVQFTNVCYYGIHYRYSCDVPNFEAETFSEILNAEANYAITPCFTINYIEAPEYYITTEPYCDGAGLFTFGITVTGGSGSYIIGEDYTGKTIYGETGENFITYSSDGEEYQSVYAYDAETGCGTDYVRLIEDPGCDTFEGACELPADSGPCEAYIPRFYYDSEAQDCQQFIYGGCQGNANNFETYELCIESCGNPTAGCGAGEPINFTWIQQILSEWGECEVYKIDQFEFDGQTFFRISPHTTEGGLECPADLLYFYYNCEGEQVCKSGFVFHGDSDNCSDEFVSAADENPINIWTYGFDICACDDVYEPVCGVDGVTYANACQAECEGVAIAYNGECGNLNCPAGDPLQQTWLQKLIIENGGCSVAELREFTYQGTPHYVTIPGYPSNLICPSDAPSIYFNCQGKFVCEVGFFPPDTPTFCNDSILIAAANARTIWTYNETNCADPFELEIVRSAIADSTCTGKIYAFNFFGEDSYIYIQSLCEFNDIPNILYNCNTGISCDIDGESIYSGVCSNVYEDIFYLINKENVIWEPTCEYEYTGTVRDYTGLDACGFLIELEDSIVLEPLFTDVVYNLYDGQRVELSYRQQLIPSICQVGIVGEILCLREIEEQACEDPFKLDIVKGAINNSNCTDGIYAFSYQNNSYVYISTLCEFVDDANLLYNCNTGEICYIGGLSFPDEACVDLYSEVQPLINNENLIWSHPCEYEHKGIVRDDPQNGCGYFIELDSIRIEPASIQGGFTLEEGQQVELSYNIIQPLGFCKADYLVSINCIRLASDSLTCANPFELDIVQAAINDTCTGGVYAFTYLNEEYVFIQGQGSCIFGFNNEPLSELYNCTTGELCILGGEVLIETCYEIYEQVQPLINDENLIWTPACENKFKGTVKEYGGLDSCRFVIELDNGITIVPIIVNLYDVTLVDGLRIQFSYKPLNQPNICQAGIVSEIFCLSKIEEGCGCDADYTPVCGVDGNTYSNACQAECEGVEIAYQGECEEPKSCLDLQDVYFGDCDQVLGYGLIAGKCVYINGCDPIVADSTDYSGYIFGLDELELCISLCEQPCICPAVYDPVCGVDGLTYSNSCEAACAGIEIQDEGECLYPCDCFDLPYEPVCGIDGQTYPNRCEADCAGVAIAYEGVCEEETENNEIFEQFPWLLELVDPSFCTNGATIDVYMKRNYYYIFVNFPGGPGSLYREDGRFYCKDGLNLVCLDAYSLTEPINSWTCNSQPRSTIEATFSNFICIEGATFSVNVNATGALSGSYGIYGRTQDGGAPTFFNFEEGETFTFTGRTSDAENNTYPIFIYDALLADVAAMPFEINIEECEDEEEMLSIFEQFPWLLDLVDPEFCADGVTIDVYMKRNYNYIFVNSPNGPGSLYREDGRFYCKDGLNLDCLDAYNLTEPISSWACNSEAQTTIEPTFSNLICNEDGTFSIDITATGAESGTYGVYRTVDDLPPVFTFEAGETLTFTAGSGNAVDNIYKLYIYDYYLADVAAIPFEIDLVECDDDNVTSPIFEQFPWLVDLVDPAFCANGVTIDVYMKRHYYYIFVNSPGGPGSLYREDGRFYCKDGLNLDCLDAYNLTEPMSSWTCNNGALTKTIKNSDIKQTLEDGEIKIYPNPNNGMFTVDVSNIKSAIQKIEIYDIAGKQYNVPVNLNENNTSINVDAENLKNGSYIITLFTANKVLHTETIIIH